MAVRRLSRWFMFCNDYMIESTIYEEDNQCFLKSGSSPGIFCVGTLLISNVLQSSGYRFKSACVDVILLLSWTLQFPPYLSVFSPIESS